MDRSHEGPIYNDRSRLYGVSTEVGALEAGMDDRGYTGSVMAARALSLVTADGNYTVHALIDALEFVVQARFC